MKFKPITVRIPISGEGMEPHVKAVADDDMEDARGEILSRRPGPMSALRLPLLKRTP